MATESQLNTNLNKSIYMDTNAMSWEASPAKGVWRKRLYRAGPEESGRVTSVVRYDAGARFHRHPHPEGEEILVLNGVFSDERGDWPAGSFLLNPEGFEHAPFSENGCELLVRLRQYPGLNRRQVGIKATDYHWIEGSEASKTVHLYQQSGFSDQQRLEFWPGNRECPLSFIEGAEIFLLSGALRVDRFQLKPRGWLRLPPGNYRSTAHRDTQLLIKEAGRRYLPQT